MLNDKLAQFPDSRDIFTNDGRPLLAGQLLVQKNLAKTLRTVATGGAEAFYKGDIGREMARAIQAAGGLYTAEEIADHQNIWYEPPISTTYRGNAVYETAPPSQGLVLLEMLNILEGYDISSLGFYNAEAVHTMVEAKKLAFADRNRYAGDPEFVSTPVDELISKPFAAQRRQLVSSTVRFLRTRSARRSHTGRGQHELLLRGGCRGQRAVVHSQPVYGIREWLRGRRNTGVLLNNRIGRGFSLVEGHPNVIEGGKRTMHTLNAYMVMRGDKPYLVGGTPGGDRQIAWNAQVITNVLDHGMSAQEAVEAPRWASFPSTDPA